MRVAGPHLLILLLIAASATAQITPPLSDEGYLVTSDGCRLYVAEYGTGPRAVIVLHGGWGAEHSYLFGALAGLDTTQYRFILYDQRGSLRSACADSSITVARMVQDLDELRASLRQSKLILFGHSMGTRLAMAYLTAYPDRVRGLVLVGAVQPGELADSDPQERARSDSLAQAFLHRPEIAAQLKREGLDGDSAALDWRQRTYVWRLRDFAGANIYHIERWREVRGGKAFYNPSVGRAIDRIPTSVDFRPALTRLSCVTQVINGDHDYLDMGGGKWQHQVHDLGHIALTLLPEAGHAAWIDQPKLFRQAVAHALSRVAACP